MVQWFERTIINMFFGGTDCSWPKCIFMNNKIEQTKMAPALRMVVTRAKRIIDKESNCIAYEGCSKTWSKQIFEATGASTKMVVQKMVVQQMNATFKRIVLKNQTLCRWTSLGTYCLELLSEYAFKLVQLF